jgi:hypothetical protein
MMKKIIAISLLIASTANAGLFDKDVKVRNFPCFENKVYDGALVVWTFVVEKTSVIQKQEVYVDKLLKGTDLYRLDNCIIVDKSNWKCGGALTTSPNGAANVDRTYQVVNGKYSFTEEAKNGVPVRKMYCKIEQVN